jgi:ABC-2 type transport system permease protein
VSDLLRMSIRFERASLIGWSLGLAAYALITVALFPSVRDTPGFTEVLESLPEAFQAFIGETASLTTIEGFLTVEYLTYLPILLGVYVIIAGTRTLVGEEEAGTMDVLMAHGVARTRVVLEKAAALGLTVVAICTAVGLAIALSGLAIAGERDVVGLFLMGLNAVPIALVLAGVALAASAWLRSRRAATVTTIVFLVVSFLVNGFAAVVKSIEGLRYVSVFYYYGESRPLSSGLDWAYVVVFLLLAAGLLGLAVVGFNRKDLAS